MPDSDAKKKLAEEVAKIDSQISALAKLKQQHLAKLASTESPENQMTREERREALADAFAEGIVYLGQKGLLPLTDDPVKPTILPFSQQAQRIKSPNEKRLKRGK